MRHSNYLYKHGFHRMPGFMRLLKIYTYSHHYLKNDPNQHIWKLLTMSTELT